MSITPAIQKAWEGNPDDATAYTETLRALQRVVTSPRADDISVGLSALAALGETPLRLASDDTKQQQEQASQGLALLLEDGNLLTTFGKLLAAGAHIGQVRTEFTVRNANNNATLKYAQALKSPDAQR